MKKRILFLMSLILLCGCTKVDLSLQQQLEKKISQAAILKADKPQYNHTYYYYYKEPSIGSISSDITSNIFSYEGDKFVMNLNVPAIINESYYRDQAIELEGLKEMTPIAELYGQFEDYENNTHSFEAKIYQIGKNELTLFSTDLFDFYAMNKNFNGPDIAAAMYRIARSTSVNKTLVVEEFSNRTTISNIRQKLELFQNIAPESGVIDELFIDHNSYTTDQKEIYNLYEDIETEEEYEELMESTEAEQVEEEEEESE